MAPRPRYRPRLGVYLFSLVLFLAGSATALLVTRGYAIDFESQSIQKRGLLALDSEPDQAEILVDGKPHDQRTNARIRLRPGSYDVEVRTTGRIPWQRTVHIDSGEAIIESITLFPESPKRTDLTDVPVGQVAVTPDGKTAAVTTRERGADRLALVDLEAGRSRTVAALPASFATVRSVAISGDGTRVLVSDRTRTAVYDQDGTHIGTLAGTSGRFVDGRVLTVSDGRIRLQAPDGDGVETAATAPRAWATTPDSLYVLGRGSTDVKVIRPGRPAERISDTKTLVSLTAADSGGVLATGRDDTFGLIRNGRYQELGGGAVQAAVTRDGRFVAYRTADELRLLEPASGKDRLVTRLADPPKYIQALPGGRYLLFRRGDTLHAIARDGSNDRAVAKYVGREPVILGLDAIITTDRRTGRLIRLDLES